MSEWTPVDRATLLTRDEQAMVDTVAKAARNLGPALVRLRASAPGQPKAAAYDGVRVSGSRSIAWCETHGCEELACERDERTGCAVVSYAVEPDPTAQAALNGDPGREVARRGRILTDKVAQSIADLAAWIEQVNPRAPSARDLRDTAKANEADDACRLCARVGEYSPTHPGLERFTAGGTIEATAVCQSCYRFVVSRGRIPTRPEAEHHAGTGRWPKTVA